MYYVGCEVSMEFSHECFVMFAVTAGEMTRRDVHEYKLSR